MKKMILINIALMILMGCSKTPIERLNAHIADFTKGTLEDSRLLKQSFLDVNSTETFSSINSAFNSRLILKKSSDSLNMILPFKIKVQNKEIKNLKYYDASSQFAVFSDGKAAHIYNKEGYVKKIDLTPEKRDIKSLILYKNNLLYYQNFRLYIHNIDSEKKRLLIKRKFMPFYSKYFKVNMKAYENTMVMVYGIAGKYALYVIDLEENRLKSQALSAASTRFAINSSHVYYTDGSSGRWRIISYDIGKRNKKVVKVLKEINDITLSPYAYILDQDNQLSLHDYSNTSYEFLKGFAFKGFFRDSILIEYHKMIHIIPVEKYLASYLDLVKKAPKITEAADKKKAD